MWVRTYYDHETLANGPNIRIRAEDRAASIIASVTNIEIRLRQRLRSYPVEVNYLLKNYATDEGITKYDAKILRYVQPTNATLQLYTVDLVAKSCKAADVYDERLQ